MSKQFRVLTFKVWSPQLFKSQLTSNQDLETAINFDLRIKETKISKESMILLSSSKKFKRRLTEELVMIYFTLIQYPLLML